MKTKLLIPLLTAVLLTTLSGCVDKIEMNNPNFDPETQEVLTDFVFNVSMPDFVTTKQSAYGVQIQLPNQANPFRGIDHAVLLTYKNLTTPILVTDQTADKQIDLDEVVSSQSLSTSKSSRILEMSLPVETNTLLFYGKAIDNFGTPYNSFSYNDCFGHLDTFVVNKTAGSAHFALGARLAYSDTLRFYTVERLLANIFTNIIHTKVARPEFSAEAIPSGGSNSYKFAVSQSEYATDEITWEDYYTTYETGTSNHISPFMGQTTPTELRPLEQKLSNLYYQMTTFGPGELRAASGEALMRTAQDLWSVINEIRCAEPMSKQEAVAKYFAQEVHVRLAKYFNGSVPSDGSDVSISGFQSTSDIKTAISSSSEIAVRPSIEASIEPFTWPDSHLDLIVATDDNIFNNFPFNFNLPRGATHIQFNSTSKYFFYPYRFDTSGMAGATGVEGGQFNAVSYFYPSEITYFGNSPVRVSDDTHKANEYPSNSGNSTNGWLNADSWGNEWSIGKVLASTRSVAMQYNINYAVALLETKVEYSSATLYDNNRFVQAYRAGYDPEQATTHPISEFTTEQNHEISADAGAFKLTGIIIGGQYQSLDWCFLPASYSRVGFIYDKAITEQDIPAYNASGATSESNYTVVNDNYARTGDQSKVYVALEFQNLGDDFFGNYNIIRHDGYFYLIGELDPATATDITPPSTWVLPPYQANSPYYAHAKRVFMQDHKTTVTFKLGPYSLQRAYLSVPDLRTGSVSLGLSVDIQWSEGLNFNNVVLGGGDDLGNPATN